MELISHEEGRIRPVFAAGQPVTYYYDYFIRDHLGNVRTVLTEQHDLSTYVATMETAAAPTETALFSNLEGSRATKPVGYPQDETTSKNEFVARLNAKEGGRKIGPSLVLRVMAGDTVQMGTKAFYKSVGPKGEQPARPEDMAASLVNALVGGASSVAAHGARQAENLGPLRNFSSNNYQRLKEKDPGQNQQDKPKAYLNFALFDDQFNLVEDNSGVRQVKGEPNELQTLAVDKMVIKCTGFLYVYTSNETQEDVFFDNVTLGVASGPLLEETHYYPFGLTMAGISSNALKGMNYPVNRKKYNGIEFTEDLDLDIYDAQLRNLDPQIGRWNQVDPKTEKMEMWSPYASNYDNPIRFNDFLGDEPEIDGGPGPSVIPVPGAGVLSAMNETAKNVGNAVGNFLGDVGVSLGGIINGMNRSSTLGTYPSVSASQFGFNERQTSLYNISTTVGQYAPSLAAGGRAGESPAVATVNGKPISTPSTVSAPAVPANQVNASTPSLEDQASKIKNEQNGGRNSVTIGTPNKQIRYDLAGDAHGGVPTPHIQVYNKNFFNGVLKRISRASKTADPMTQQDIRLVRKYLEKVNK